MATRIPSVEESLADPVRPPVARRIAKNLHWIAGIVLIAIIGSVLMYESVKQEQTAQAAKAAKEQQAQIQGANLGGEAKDEDLAKAIAATASGPVAKDNAVPDELKGGGGKQIPSAGVSAPNPSMSGIPASSGGSKAADALGTLPPVPPGTPALVTKQFGPGAYSNGNEAEEQKRSRELDDQQRREKILSAPIIAQQGNLSDKSSTQSAYPSANRLTGKEGDASEGTDIDAARQKVIKDGLDRLKAAQGGSQAEGGGSPMGMADTGANARAGTDEAWQKKTRRETSSPSADAIQSDGKVGATTLIQGAIIPVVTTTAINSDLPGQITAISSMDVYDSMSGKFLLIPKGTKFVGMYNNTIVVGQERVMAAFTRMIRPDGVSVNLGGMGASDSVGQAGLAGDVNNHFFKMFFSSFCIAALSNSLIKNDTVSSNSTSGQVVGSAAGQVLTEVAQTILNRNKSIAPTITIPQATPFTIIVAKDLALPAYRSGK